MERGGGRVAAARALCKGSCINWWPYGEGVRCSDCAGDGAPRSLVAPDLQGCAQEQETRHLLLCPALGMLPQGHLSPSCTGVSSYSP